VVGIAGGRLREVTCPLNEATFGAGIRVWSHLREDDNATREEVHSGGDPGEQEPRRAEFTGYRVRAKDSPVNGTFAPVFRLMSDS